MLFALLLLAAADSYSEAAKLFAAGRFEQAEPVLRLEATRAPRSFPVRFLLGATLAQLGNHREAIDHLAAAHRLRPRDRDAAKLLAAEHLQARDPSPAIRVLAGLPRVPDEEVSLLLFQAYVSRADPGDAEASAKVAAEAVRAFPESPRLRVCRAWVLREAGRFQEARLELERALEAEPGEPTARAMLGDISRREGRLEEAMALFRSVLASHPGDTEAVVGLSRILRDLDRLAEATAEVKKAIESNPRNARLRLELSQLLLRSGDAEGAAREAEAFRRLRSPNVVPSDPALR